MQIAQVMGGFSMGQGDVLRKAMGKKKYDLMEKQKVVFLKGAAERGVAEADANAVWDLMVKFAEYGFNKAHTVAYAEVAFRTAYLKAHFPVEFMAALMTNDMGDTDKMSVLFGEAREMGIKILPPDVNESHEDFSVVEGNVRFGLGGIKNVGEAAIRDVIAEREKDGPFTSFQNFCERALDKGVNSRMMECLIKAGAFDSLVPNRASLFAGKDKAVEQAQMIIRERDSGQMSLFGVLSDSGGAGAAPLAEAPLPQVPEWSDAEKLAYEKELTGFFITGHPLDALAIDMRSFSTATTAEFAELPNNNQVRMVGQIADVRRITTRKNEPMAFCRLEDFHGAIDMVVFPSKFADIEPWLVSGAMVCARGRVNERNGSKSLIVDELSEADVARKRLARFLDVTLPVKSISSDNVALLKRALGRHTGRCKVRIILETPEGPLAVQSDQRYGVSPDNELLKDIEALPFSKTLTFKEN